MQYETVIIIFLIIVIIFLLRWQLKYQQRQLHNNIILSLLSYSVQQYSMEALLEKCLATIFLNLEQCCIAKGAIFLQTHQQLEMLTQQGLSDNESHKIWTEGLLGIWVDEDCFQMHKADDFQFISAAEAQAKHGYFIIPLVINEYFFGVLSFYTKTEYQPSHQEIVFIKTLGTTLARLIKRKQVTDDSYLCHKVVESSQQAIFITNSDNQIIRCNQACEHITGYSHAELIGQNPRIFKSNYHCNDFYTQLWQEVKQKGFWQGEIWNKHKNGTIYPEWLTISEIKEVNEKVTQYLAVFTDLTSVKKAEKDIHQLAFYDSLTSLANRKLFNLQIDQAVTLAQQQGTEFALLCLDVDHFKKINDSLGHQVGDKLLQILANRIKNSLDKEMCIARVGGDEFSVLIQGIPQKDDTQVVDCAKKLLDCLSDTVQLEEHEIIITVSIGVSYYPNDSDSAVDLIKYADSALNQAKKLGRNNYQFYTEKLNQQALRKIHLESGLRQALKNNDFIVYLQPQLDLETQLMIGAEALLRARKGLLLDVSPAEYIPVAEELGLIVEIGDWVFCEVCRLLKYWHDKSLIPENFKRVAINISPAQFKRHNFVKKMQRCIEKTGVPVQYLELELTESSLQESNHSVIEKLFAIKAMGITIAIDDFGTGYSSLSRLKDFPIDLLKIDRSFVNDLSQNQSDMAIVKAIVSMAQAINIKTLAEGVETEAQRDILKTLRCNYSQGFLHSKPVKSDVFEKKLIQLENNKTLIEGVMDV